MENLRVAAAQFEHKNNDAEFNLSRIDELTGRAVEMGAQVVSFHECCIQAYTFVQEMPPAELAELAEPVPDGPSTQALIALSRKHGIPILAGLFELKDDRVYNTYVCVSQDGVLAKFSKLHPFVNPHLAAGDGYVVFDLLGWKCGMLICYDNNIIENVRMNALLGAQLVFMPHVTGCLPSAMPGRGLVDPELWHRREVDPVPLRQEFMGPKGRGWLLRWLPARAYDNGIYAVFTNPVGIDDGEVRNGNAMVLDPFGEIIAESNALGDDVVVGVCTPEKLELASGRRYIRARRVDLFDKLVESSGEPPVTEPGWKLKYK